MRATVVELKNAVCLFSQLSAASNLQFHGFDEKEIKSHVEYCKHLLEFAKFTVRWSSACEDQLNKQRLELLLKSLPLRKISESRGPVETSGQFFVNFLIVLYVLVLFFSASFIPILV